MSFQDLIRQRYSVRGYKPDPVPDDLLAQEGYEVVRKTVRVAEAGSSGMTGGE